jgi:hypothetical protein
MLSATIATATLGAAMAGEAQANTLSTTIAPMPLNRALEQFAKQTGLQVVYVSATEQAASKAQAPQRASRAKLHCARCCRAPVSSRASSTKTR